MRDTAGPPPRDCSAAARAAGASNRECPPRARRPADWPPACAAPPARVCRRRRYPGLRLSWVILLHVRFSHSGATSSAGLPLPVWGEGGGEGVTGLTPHPI